MAIATSAAAVQGLILVSNLFDILSPDPSLPGGATLNFRYQDLGSEALEQELRVYRFDAGLFMWELVADIGPDTANNLFILPITHLSLYAVFLQDEVAPITSLDLLEGRKFVSLSGQVFISSKTAHILSARDPPLGRLAGSGVLGTEFRIDSTALPFNPYIAGSSLSFPAEGFHSIQFRSFDLAHNTEPIKSASLATDNTPPRAVLFSQQPFISIDGGIAVLAPLATVQVIINDPLNNLAASGIDLTGIAYSLDGGSTISVTGLEFSIALGSGTHVLNVSVKDNVGNELNQVFKVLIGDVLPPQSMLMIGPPKLEPASAQDPVFITQNSFLTLISTDDFSLAGDALGLGVAFQKVSMNAAGRFTFNNPNPGQGSAFISSFTLSGEADGLYALEFFAEDVIGNKETAQTTTVAVDNSHPLTSVHISGPQFKAIGDVPGAIGGPLFIATHSLISLDAVDPIVNGAASGLKETKFNIDAGPFEVFASSFTLSEGKRTLLMASKDRLDNEELLKTFEVSVDQTPPQTTVSYAGPAAFPNHPSDAQPSDTDAFITGQTGIVLSAQDPVSQEVASGVKEIKYKINGGEFLVYAGSFTLPAPGVYLIEYFAKDRVDHAEAPRFLKVAVDNAVPETSLAVGQPSFQAFSETLITPETPITLSAVDPLVNNAASGLKEILFSVDQTPLAVYSSTFTLAQGTHTVSFLAKDRLGNAGVMQKKIFHVSALQQHALVTGQGASDLDGNVRIEGSIASSGAFTANGNPVSVSSVIASAIRLVGNATIEGDAILTAGTTDQIELTGNASIKGSRLVNPTLAPQPSPIDLAALLANVSQSNSNHLIPSQYLVNGSLIIKDQTLTLTTGQYLINGLEVTGNGEIKVQGPVALFVRGVVTWEGNALINKTDKASNLLIFSDSSEIFLAKGNVEAAVFVYAPLSSAEIDGNVRLAGHAYFASASIKGNPILYETDGLLPPKEGNNQNNAGNDDEGSKKTASLASAPSQFGPDPAFKLGEIYAFPNPAVSGQRPTLHIESGLADGAQIRVYDMAGELVAESSLSGQPGIVDRGTGIKYAYEHTLDRHLPTDVYLYVVTTQKEGQTLKKAGRFSVVR
ncbi:MAG: T9SS type A sorting domain-containing protein [Elusimicrobia bacterium]|nr:T9SS type A sorting domain-containing protein [Elusimicrobiota bacterium]